MLHRPWIASCALVACVLLARPIAPQQTPPPAPVQMRTNPADGLKYVFVPAGTFRMGCSPRDKQCDANESPAHTVTLPKGFWLGQTPVTQAAYKTVTSASPSQFHGDQLPVEGVSWDEARAYCERVQMRLPTEAEYEYATRAGTTGALYGKIGDIAWYSDNAGGSTHDVGQKVANAFGLYDMLGNVYEWVADWFGPYTAAAAQDPQGPATGQHHVVRGVVWAGDPTDVRASVRNWTVPGLRNNLYIGFRCAGE